MGIYVANATDMPLVHLWGETVFLVVLEVVLHCMFCEKRISDSQETFIDVHINRTVVQLHISVVFLEARCSHVG